MAGNPSFNSFLSSTLYAYREKLTDAITQNNALLAHLKMHGFVTEEAGSRGITAPLMYAENSTVKSYNGYDLLDVSPQDNITTALFPWRFVSGSVTISGDEEWQNSGSKSQIFDLLKSKIMVLQISMRNAVNRMLVGDGTGNSGKDLMGLDALVEDGGAWSMIGGIDAALASNAFWRNQWSDFPAGVFEDASGKTTVGVRHFRNMINASSNGTDRTSLILTAQAVYEAYMATLSDHLRFTDTKLGDLGFSNIKLDDVPVVWDADVPTDDSASDYTSWFLNKNYLKFVTGKGRTFNSTEFVRPSNQDAKTSQVFLYGNLITSNRRRQGRSTNIRV